MIARWCLVLLGVVLGAASLQQSGGASAQAQSFEVWAIDQADADKGGAKLYIYQDASLKGPRLTAEPEVIELDLAAEGVGDGPGVRPHLLLFNQNQTHAVLAYVASGHVQVIRADSRQVVASIDVGEQAHGGVPSPDGSFILVANQNGKKLARIRSDFAQDQYTYEPSADLDLKAWESESLPDNAPICPLLFGPDGRKAYVSLRGGGMLIVDAASTPMTVVKSFTNNDIKPAGCGGVMVGSKMYVNAGTPTTGRLHVLDTETDTLLDSINTRSTGSDPHGMVLVGGGRYLWMTNRGTGDNIVVLDTEDDTFAGTIEGIGAAPDLMDVSPGADQVVLTLRGPQNLTGGPAAKGETPGIAVLSVQEDGRTGTRSLFVPIGDQSEASIADPPAIAVRATTPR